MNVIAMIWIVKSYVEKEKKQLHLWARNWPAHEPFSMKLGRIADYQYQRSHHIEDQEQQPSIQLLILYQQVSFKFEDVSVMC